jgi:hypothetical protein
MIFEDLFATLAKDINGRTNSNSAARPMELPHLGRERERERTKEKE